MAFPWVAAIVATGVTTFIGSTILKNRGKAFIGDTVEFKYQFGVVGGVNFGTQSAFLTGRVIAKRDPIQGPFYDIQLFAVPDVIKNNPALLSNIPSVIQSVKDSDITRNLGKMATPAPAK